MTLRKLLSFTLLADFHADCGWLAAVRNRKLDIAASTFLRERHPELLVGKNPETVIAGWRPAGGRMLYYLRRKGGGPCQFVATDGIFAHTIDSNGSESWSFSGPIAGLLRCCDQLWQRISLAGECPMVPLPNGYPSAMVIHELVDNRAILALGAAPAPPRSVRPKEAQCWMAPS